MLVNSISGPKNTRTHGANGALQNPRYVLITEAVVLPQKEGGSQLFRQVGNGIAELFLQLVPLQQTLWRGDVAEATPAVKVLCFGRISAALRPSATGLKMVFRSVHRNPVQPGIKSTITTKAVNGTICLDERLLSKVHDFLTVVDITADN